MTATRPERYLAFAPSAPQVPVRNERRNWRWWSVHLEHSGAPDAEARMLLLHGAGGNAAAMRPLAARIADRGVLVTAVDLPGYGETAPRPGSRPPLRALRYEQWRALAVRVLRELDDGRPLLVAGVSIGGMLALEAAALSGRAGAVLATCVLDVRDAETLAAVMRLPRLAPLAPLLRLCRGPLGRLRIPLALVTPMRRAANDPRLVAEALRDTRGAGGRMPLAWYDSFLHARPVLEPGDPRLPPVVLAHPAEDRWTAPELSLRALAALAPGHETVMLPGGGHLPVEEPALSELAEAARRAVRLAERRAGREPGSPRRDA